MICSPIFLYNITMRIKVIYSLQHDIDNYTDSLYRFRWNKHGRENIQEVLLKPFSEDFKKSLKKATNKKEAQKIVEKFLLQGLDGRKQTYLAVANNLETAWKESGDAIIKKLEKIYGKEVPFNLITVYLSSIPICPYNFKQRWIYAFAGTSTQRQLRILTHELNHFMFLFHFGNLKDKVGNDNFESLKEALTVFTNPEEKGYPAQQKLRTWLNKQKGTVSEIITANKWQKHL